MTALPRMLAVLAALAPAATSQQLLHAWHGGFDDDQWGSTVEVIGDVNADGHRDIAVGAPFADRFVATPFPVIFENVGVVRVYSGDDGALLHTWSGSLAGGDQFGAAIADAGDVNFDGRDDVLIGAPEADGPFVLRTGIVELRSGHTGNVLRTFNGSQSDSRFGQTLAAGDMDGDGIRDVAVGSPDFDIHDSHGGVLQEGAVTTFRCSDGGLIDHLPGNVFPSGALKQVDLIGFGLSLAYVGDSDGNGFGEVLVGAPASTFLHAGFPDVPQTGIIRQFEPATGVEIGHIVGDEGDLLGADLAVLGDPDGDGELDVAVGSPGAAVLPPPFGIPVGAVRIMSGLDERVEFFSPGDEAIGWHVAAGADANGDGLPDLLVGVPLADVVTVLFTKVNAGRVYVHSGLDGSQFASFAGESSGDRLGGAVAMGEVDGQPLAELILGAPQADVGADNGGSVFVYNLLDCPQPASWVTYGEGLAGSLGVPVLAGLGTPALGETPQLLLSNSAGQDTLCFLLLGLAPASVPARGGTVLVDALLNVAFVLPSSGAFLDLPIPADPNLCGLSVFTQTILADDGGPFGAAFSAGLELIIGH